MGPCGNGKTSLMNNICNTSYLADQASHSLTRNITQEKVQHIAGEFIIYDTAGTTSNQQISLHARLLQATLTYKPLNVIYVHIKYDNRTSHCVDEMLLQVKPITKYEDHVVYLISHFDQSKNCERDVKDICQEMTRRKMNQQVVFYSNERCEKQRLSQLLYDVASNYFKIKIEISQDDFLRNFRVGSLQVLFEKEQNLRIEEIKDIKKIYTDHMLGLPDNEEREAIVQDLILSFKYDLKDQFEMFTRQAGEKMQELDYYGVYYELQKLILDSVEEFTRQAVPYQRYSLISLNVTGKKMDIRDLVKQCPSCGLRWLRVESCPNTTCGNRPTSFWDFSIKRFFSRYRVKRVGKKLKVDLEQQKKLAESDVRLSGTHQANSNLEEYKKKSMKRGVGCGLQMNFEDLPRLPDIEDILKEWYQVATMTEVEAKMMADQYAVEEKRKQESLMRQSLQRLTYE